MYLDAIKSFPKSDTKIHTEKGSAFHIKTDVFKRQMWYAYEGEAAIGSGLIALDPDRVREIVAMNKEGKKPKELLDFVAEVVVKEPDYTNVVGQDSLNRFEHAFKAKKKKKKNGPRREQGGTPSTNQPKVQTSPQNKPEGNENRPSGNNRNKRHKRRGGNSGKPNGNEGANQ
jgi:hypothetical protein